MLVFHLQIQMYARENQSSVTSSQLPVTCVQNHIKFSRTHNYQI